MNKRKSVLLFSVLFILFACLSVLTSGVSHRGAELVLLSGISAAAAVSDLRSRRIPDKLVQYGILLRMLFIFLDSYFSHPTLPILQGPDVLNLLVMLKQALSFIFTGILTALFISVPILLLVLLADKVFDKETLGGGDLKLIFMLSLYFDLNVNLYGLMYACILGILTVLICISRGIRRRAIPFGPSLVMGFFLALTKLA